MNFTVAGAEAPPFTAAPLLVFKVELEEAGRVHAGFLRCQIRIEPARREYDDIEAGKLQSLFGPRTRWSETQRTFLWTNVAVTVPSFEDRTKVDVAVPCTLDFSVAATRYLDAVGGAIPLLFLFSGTIFLQEDDGGLRASPIPWEKEARFALGAASWKEAIAAHHPGTAFLTVRRDLLDRLDRFRETRPIPTWDRAIEDLLAGVRA